MKVKSIVSALAVVAFSGSAFAQTTVIDITGATAFRSAAVTAINSAFAEAGNSSFARGFANTGTALNSTANFTNSTCQIWRGTFPGINGTTIIRTSWNGSVEGIRAVARPGLDGGVNNDPLYIIPSLLGANGTVTEFRLHNNDGGPGAAVNAQSYERAESDMAFSDVAVSATPVTGLALTGGPVGVVVFTMIGNKTWAEDVKAGIIPASASNVTAQQFRTLANAGFLPMSFFTGRPTDTTRVYLTGRNDGSGTRTSYLSETGVGAATPIRQYIGYDRTNSTILPSIYLPPANGGFFFNGNANPSARSTVWGNNLDGNGGYSSGGDIRTDLSKSTASTSVWEFVDINEDGVAVPEGAEQVRAAEKLYLLTYLTYDDARSSRGDGLASARNSEILGYNGIRLDQLAGDNPQARLTNAPQDLAKVVNGVYTPWNFQQLYYISTRAGAAAVFNRLRTSLNTDADLIGTAGVPIGFMQVNRVVDGGLLFPGAPPQP